MKKLTLFTLACCLTLLAAATTRSLNNSNPSPGQYLSWTSVADASSDGDTILIQGSMVNYYTLTVSKRLTIIGPGHNPTDKQNQQKAFCDVVLFISGSNGSKIIGVQASNMQAYAVDVDSVSILQCKITDAVYFTYANSNHWLIDGCVFTNTGFCLRGQGNAVGDMHVRNSIFNGPIYSFNGAFIGYNYVYNNLFLGSTTYTLQYCSYFYVDNNIFYRSGIQDYANIGTVFTKNVSYNCQGGNTFPNGTNYENVDPLFVTNIGTGANFDYATDYHLQPSSPVLTGGVDGTEVGVYGGVGDYQQEGIGHNPYIQTFNITGPTSVNAGDPIQVYIKAKVRN